jgi:glycosyltransferase involved in cell wall biosynthesis
MKVLLLSYSDSGGGAAIAAVRLLNALRNSGLDATLGVIDKCSNAEAIVCIRKERNIFAEFRLLWDKVLHKSFSKLWFPFKTANPVQHSENKWTLLDLAQINNSDYDLVHLHWVNNNMLSIEDVAKITKPIVWTMHDCWLFCGAEHYPNIWENDLRFEQGYIAANRPATIRGVDICQKTWQRKIKSWVNKRFQIISPSQFQRNLFERSALFKDSGSACAVIPYIIPSDIFRPLDKLMLKRTFGIPLDKSIIGFGAAYGINNSNKSIKGGNLLLQSLEKIRNPEDFYCVIFGQVEVDFLNLLPIKAFAAGNISNPYILAAIYNLCDVFVCPSVIENLPNTCLESLFCGVPIAAFATGGIPDIVEHKRTGYLAKLFDTEDLFRGIRYCLDNQTDLIHNSIAKAKRDFNNRDVVDKHIELYKTLLTI